MPLDLAAVQAALRDERLDGWLLYDFHGSNPVAARLAGTDTGDRVSSRRWYYLIPATGTPRALVHAIERHNLDALPGDTTVYAGRAQLDAGLTNLLAGVSRVAMEYSPGCAIPYLSRVDAGTIDAVRARGVAVVSSGDLVQQFESTWSASQLASHYAASAALYRIKDRAFDAVRDALACDTTWSEHDLQQRMMAWFREEGLVSDSPPVVAVGANAGNPHYLPTASTARPIVRDAVLLLDLWGKLAHAGAVFADITWVAVTGAQVPDRVAAAFAAVAAARDEAVDVVQAALASSRPIRGWEADRAARAVLETRGFGASILHRTGHNLGQDVHGTGAHLDDFETHDVRRLIPRTGFTVEPGLYFEDFGIRSEINVYMEALTATVTGPRQHAVVTLT